jgi:hypothetical protein
MRQLSPLEGLWVLEASVDGAVAARGSSTFEWIVLQIWRDAPGFFQHFTANVQPDRIVGAWERSDGSDWTKDFDVLYRR